MPTERILTRHPEGKEGVNIDAAKYEDMKRALLAVVPAAEPGVKFGDLRHLVAPHLSEQCFREQDSLSWYVTTIKLDLEARGLLRRLPGSPQRLVRAGGRK